MNATPENAAVSRLRLAELLAQVREAVPDTVPPDITDRAAYLRGANDVLDYFLHLIQPMRGRAN